MERDDEDEALDGLVHAAEAEDSMEVEERERSASREEEAWGMPEEEKMVVERAEEVERPKSRMKKGQRVAKKARGGEHSVSVDVIDLSV